MEIFTLEQYLKILIYWFEIDLIVWKYHPILKLAFNTPSLK